MAATIIQAIRAGDHGLSPLGRAAYGSQTETMAELLRRAEAELPE